MGGGARPFLLGRVICLVDSFNRRDHSLLNGVKHDSYLITSQKEIVCLKYAFSASWQVINLYNYSF